MTSLRLRPRWSARPVVLALSLVPPLALGGCGGGAAVGSTPPFGSGALPFASLGECADAIAAALASDQPGDRLDTDGDSIPDVVEERLGTNPADSDSDRDGIPDAVELFPSGFARGDPLPDRDLDGRIAPLDDDDDGDHRNDGVDVDTDGDGVSNYLELYGYTFDALTGRFEPWDGDPAVPHFFTDPLQPSTDQDAYPDGTEASHALEDPTVRSPGDDPLVPAYPNLVCELVSYSVTLDDDIQVTESESHSKGETWDRQTDRSHSYGVQSTWEVGTEASFGKDAGLKVSAKYGQTSESTNSTTTSVATGGSITDDAGWSTARSMNPTHAALLKLYLRMHNRGTAPVSHLVPTLALRIGGLNVMTFEPAGASVNLLPPGATYPAESGWLWVVDARNSGGGTEPLALTISELRALERGAPISLTVTQVKGDAMRLSSQGTWESVGDTNEFTARCDAVCANLRIELADGTLVQHLVYAGDSPTSPVMTLGLAMSKLGVDAQGTLHYVDADGAPRAQSLDGFATAIDAATLRANGWALAADDPTGQTTTSMPPGFVLADLRLHPDSVVYVRAPRPPQEPSEPLVEFASLDSETGEILVSASDYVGVASVRVHNQYDPSDDLYRTEDLTEALAGAGFFRGNAQDPGGFAAGDVLTAEVENLDGLVVSRELGTIFVSPGPQKPVIHSATLDLDALRIYANVESGNPGNPNSDVQWIRAYHPDLPGGYVDLQPVFDYYQDPFGFEAALPANFGQSNRQDVDVVAYVTQGVYEVAPLSFADATAVAVRHNEIQSLQPFVDGDKSLLTDVEYFTWKTQRIDFDAAAGASTVTKVTTGPALPSALPQLPGAPTDVMLEYPFPSATAWATAMFNAQYKKLDVGGLETYRQLSRDDILAMDADITNRATMKLGSGDATDFLRPGDVLALKSTSGRAAKLYVESVTYDHNVLKNQRWANVTLRYVVFD